MGVQRGSAEAASPPAAAPDMEGECDDSVSGTTGLRSEERKQSTSSRVRSLRDEMITGSVCT